MLLSYVFTQALILQICVFRVHVLDDLLDITVKFYRFCNLLDRVFFEFWAKPFCLFGSLTDEQPPENGRCERAYVGNTIGQANGVYDKPLDLRLCDYTNDQSNLKGKSLSAALMSDAKFDGADMSEVVMSKAYAVGASFKGVNFSNAVLDRVNFEKANLQGAVFKNTLLSGSTFNEAKLEDAVFEDTIIGYIDLQKLCTNRTINEEGRMVLGCR